MSDSKLLSRRGLLSRSGAACAALGTLALAPSAQAARSASQACVLNGLQPVMLTISGPGVQPNRGKPQAVADRMLQVHSYQFESAWSCGLDARNSLEQHALKATLEYDEAEHSLQGPLLENVLQASGVDIGKAMTQGWDSIRSRVSASIAPHSGVGGCAPRPRKPRPAASRMASESPSAACTMSGARQFGSTVTVIRRNFLTPETLAAVT